VQTPAKETWQPKPRYPWKLTWKSNWIQKVKNRPRMQQHKDWYMDIEKNWISINIHQIVVLLNFNRQKDQGKIDPIIIACTGPASKPMTLLAVLCRAFREYKVGNCFIYLVIRNNSLIMMRLNNRVIRCISWWPNWQTQNYTYCSIESFTSYFTMTEVCIL